MDPLDRLMRVYIVAPIAGRDDLKVDTIVQLPKRGAMALVETGYAVRVSREGVKHASDEPLGEKHTKSLSFEEMLTRLPPAEPGPTPATPKPKRKDKTVAVDG